MPLPTIYIGQDTLITLSQEFTYFGFVWQIFDQVAGTNLATDLSPGDYLLTITIAPNQCTVTLPPTAPAGNTVRILSCATPASINYYDDFLLLPPLPPPPPPEPNKPFPYTRLHRYTPPIRRGRGRSLWRPKQ